MALEFIFFFDRTKGSRSQNLPELFREEFYNGNKHVYVHSKSGNRFRCELVSPNGRPVRITGVRWKEFCDENVSGGRLLHFIQQGDDTFYVTCYDDDGYEMGYYPGEIGRPQRIVTRVWPFADYHQDFPSEFLQGLNPFANIRVRANNVDEFIVRVNYVESEPQSGKFVYRIMEEDWNSMAGGLGLESSMFVVFTKERMNRLHLMAFNTNGTQVTIPAFKGLTSILRVQRPLYPFEEDDKRLKHVCYWPDHRHHFGEKLDTFYKPYNSTIDQQRLAIPAPFLLHHPLHTHRKVLMMHNDFHCEFSLRMDHHTENPTRINHVNAFGKWKEFAGNCQFGYHKMVRFKYKYTIEGVRGDEDSIPVFDVC